MTRSGFVALAGRPNAGKSTLVNRIVGGKVAIVSDKPQTTRREIRGIATGADWQLVLVDLPGVQRPARRAHRAHAAQRRARASPTPTQCCSWSTGSRRSDAGDRFIAEAIRRAGVPAVTALNKVDRLDKARTVAALSDAAALDVQGDVFPVSARTGAGVGPLVAGLAQLLPEGPFLYPPEDKSDLSEEVRLAELVREQVLLRTREELPHAVEVEIDELEEREDGLLMVRARVWAETESQKGILVGAGGRMVKAIGTAARREIEASLGRRVHLDLRVRVRKGWRRDEGLLDRLGIE